MTVLKQITESAQNSMGNKDTKASDETIELDKTSNETLKIDSPKAFKNPPMVLKTPRNENVFVKQASETTIQLDFTQVAAKSPITSTPLGIKKRDLGDKAMHSDNSSATVSINTSYSTNATSNTTSTSFTRSNNAKLGNKTGMKNANLSNILMSSTSFIEKDDFMENMNKVINIGKERLKKEGMDVSVMDDDADLNELEEVDDAKLIKSLTSTLIKIRNNLNCYKVEAMFIAQNTDDLWRRNEVENRLMKRELERLKYDLDKKGNNKDDVTKVAKESLENFEVLTSKNRELTKKALKYKVKYNRSKEIVRAKNTEIANLKKSLKSPPRFKILQQKFPKDMKNLDSNDSTISPEHTIVTESPTSSQSSCAGSNLEHKHAGSNNANSNAHNNDAAKKHGDVRPTLGVGIHSEHSNINHNTAISGTKPVLPPVTQTLATMSKAANTIRAYDTLNMLASQAISYERNQAAKARKSNSEQSIPTMLFNSKHNYDFSRKSDPTTKLPGISHLLNNKPSPSFGSVYTNMGQDKDIELNSNDTIEENV